jgi:hypothetical protein
MASYAWTLDTDSSLTTVIGTSARMSAVFESIAVPYA